MVLFTTCFRLDTLGPIPVKVPVRKKLSKTPIRGFWQKTTAEGILLGVFFLH